MLGYQSPNKSIHSDALPLAFFLVCLDHLRLWAVHSRFRGAGDARRWALK